MYKRQVQKRAEQHTVHRMDTRSQLLKTCARITNRKHLSLIHIFIRYSKSMHHWRRVVDVDVCCAAVCEREVAAFSVIAKGKECTLEDVYKRQYVLRPLG